MYDRPLYFKNYLGFGLKQFYTDLKKYKKVNHNENEKNRHFPLTLMSNAICPTYSHDSDAQKLIDFK